MDAVWVVLSALSTALAAGFAGVQIWWSRKDANSRAALEHLRNIGEKALAASKAPTEEAQQELLEYYQRDRPDLTSAAEAFLSLLNSLDLLAFAVHKGLVDRESIDEHVRTLVNERVLSLGFLKNFQACCDDSSVYEHLYRYFTELRASSKHSLT